MADLLSAVSLLLALMGMIYGVWYSAISEALAIAESIPRYLADAHAERRQVRHALRMRARPLAWSAGALTAVVLPDTLGIVWSSMTSLRLLGLVALRDYDAVQTALVLVALLSALFTWHLFQDVRDLKRLLVTLEQ